ncbi:MAG: hypothetical protein R2823_05865 [Acidimicrobiia bacterium]
MALPAPVNAFLAATRSRSPRARLVRGILGFTVFVAVTWWAWTSVDGIEMEWGWVVVLFVVGVPLALTISALEQHASTWLAGVTVSFGSSFRTAVTASAANYLPIPGAAIVRIGALSRAGATTAYATVVAVWLGLEWLAITAVFVSPQLVVSDLVVVGAAVGASGVFFTAGMAAWFKRRYPVGTGAVSASLGIVSVRVLFNGFTAYVGLRAVGATVSAGVALLVSASSVLASALGIFPGGLGVREFFAGVLASIGDFDPATAALGAVVTRATMTVALGITFAWIAVVQRGHHRAGVE